MSRIAHLSDLHLGSGDRLQPRILDGLIHVLRGQKIDLLVLTGDVFDSSTADAAMVDRFVDLFERLDQSVGGAQTLIMPGNHDRRDEGVFTPWSGGLFERLAERFRARWPHVTVLGNETPFLSTLIDVPGIDADIAVYDSTYVPVGLVSAGGLIRQDDLINLADRLRTRASDRPVLFLLHHHLIPTPVTDTSLIGTEGRPWWQKAFVNQLLPNLIGSGNREELTMTALGAGTALTTLQLLGRAVVVLHGHKHYPSARLLKGLTHAEGDVVITSAGSCGIAEALTGLVDDDEAPRLWPSLNLLDLSPQGVDVHQLAWSPYEHTRQGQPKPLVSATRVGTRWNVRHEAGSPPPFEPVLLNNDAAYALRPSTQFLERYDVLVERTVRAAPSAPGTDYGEVISGAPQSRVVNVRFDGAPQDELVTPARVQLPLRGSSSWSILGGAASTVAEASKRYGVGTAYEFVHLLNRNRCAKATLSLDLGPVTTTPFASATDLTTGKERPIALRRDGTRVWCEYDECPARVLLRISWPVMVG